MCGRIPETWTEKKPFLKGWPVAINKLLGGAPPPGINQETVLMSWDPQNLLTASLPSVDTEARREGRVTSSNSESRLHPYHFACI